MPISDPDLKDWSLELYQQIKPQTVLDIGAGSGTYAKLMRSHHACKWTAVEAWGPYVEQFSLDTLYDQVIVADARYLSGDVFMVDLVILGDVIEHMTKPDAVKLLCRIKRFAQHIIVSIPIGDWPQGAVGGVPFEEHKASWYEGEMQLVLPGCEWKHEGVLSVYHWSRK